MKYFWQIKPDPWRQREAIMDGWSGAAHHGFVAVSIIFRTTIFSIAVMADPGRECVYPVVGVPEPTVGL
jgi:hypothetical protein